MNSFRHIYWPSFLFLLVAYLGALFFSTLSRDALDRLLKYYGELGDLATQAALLATEGLGQESQWASDVEAFRADTEEIAQHSLFRFIGDVEAEGYEIMSQLVSALEALEETTQTSSSSSEDITRQLGRIASILNRLADVVSDHATRQIFAFNAYFFLLFVVLVLGIVLVVAIRRELRLRLREEQRRAKLSRALLENRDERKRALARELHDTVAQELYGALLTIREQDRTVAEQRVQRTLEIVRRLSHSLHPVNVAKIGVGPALEHLVNDVSATTNTTIEMFTRGLDAVELPPTVAQQVHEIAQEALANIVRHANATRATVRLTVAYPELRLLVTDDGCGFDQKSTYVGSGIGLISMEERARLAGGSLMVRSTPGHGTVVTVSVLLPESSVSLEDAESDETDDRSR